MGFIAKFFTKRGPTTAGRPTARLDLLTRNQTRKEILAMAVRDTLRKYGVPAGTVTSDALASNAAGRPDGVHLLLVFREWNPTLLPYMVSLEHMVLSRLSRLDPLSRTWLAGVSWRFEPTQSSQWPKLPAVGQWAGPQSASTRSNQDSRKELESLFGLGDLAFFKHCSRGGEFSPTLPMHAGLTEPVTTGPRP